MITLLIIIWILVGFFVALSVMTNSFFMDDDIISDGFEVTLAGLLAFLSMVISWPLILVAVGLISLGMNATLFTIRNRK